MPADVAPLLFTKLAPGEPHRTVSIHRVDGTRIGVVRVCQVADELTWQVDRCDHGAEAGGIEARLRVEVVRCGGGSSDLGPVVLGEDGGESDAVLPLGETGLAVPCEPHGIVRGRLD